MALRPFQFLVGLHHRAHHRLNNLLRRLGVAHDAPVKEQLMQIIVLALVIPECLGDIPRERILAHPSRTSSSDISRCSTCSRKNASPDSMASVIPVHPAATNKSSRLSPALWRGGFPPRFTLNKQH